MTDRYKSRASTRAAAFCDECAHHWPTALTPAQACRLGHRPRFFIPHTMRDAVPQNYGWKRRCADFSPATAGKQENKA